MSDELFHPTVNDLVKVMKEVGKRKQKELKNKEEKKNLNEKCEEPKRRMVRVTMRVMTARNNRSGGNSSYCEQYLVFFVEKEPLSNQKMVASEQQSKENVSNVTGKPIVGRKARKARKNGKNKKSKKTKKRKSQKQETPEIAEKPDEEPISEPSTSRQPKSKKVQKKQKRASK